MAKSRDTQEVKNEVIEEVQVVEAKAEEIKAEEPKKADIVLTSPEATALGNYLRHGMTFVDAKKKILEARKPVKLVNVADAKISEAKKEVKLGKKDSERKLHLCNLLSMGKPMKQAMKLAYGEGCENIDGVIYTKDQLKLLEATK